MHMFILKVITVHITELLYQNIYLRGPLEHIVIQQSLSSQLFVKQSIIHSTIMYDVNSCCIHKI